ncbi:MAG TPA: formyltransferase family protein [Thermoanaerobaculia bacterium]|nr:formyltransferase family protein [Thermoanaerobaculia bacterium]
MLTFLRPLRVAVLSSHRCPGAADLLADPALGRRWELACVFSSEPAFETRPLFLDADVPFVSYPIREFYRRRKAPLSDMAVRREYDEEAAALLRLWEPDLLLFSSYLYVATPALLDAGPEGAINIHGSDLRLLGADGRPKYPGLRAVSDAILAGEPETRATSHWVTEEVDAGPVIRRSAPYPVAPFVRELLADGNRRAVKAYACAHQEWMLADAWGPLAVDAVRHAFMGRRAPDLDLVPVPAMEASRP